MIILNKKRTFANPLCYPLTVLGGVQEGQERHGKKENGFGVGIKEE